MPEYNAETDPDDPAVEELEPKLSSGYERPETRTLGVVLAAGAGSRFHGDRHKLAMKLEGKPLLWWATTHAMAAGFEEVLVVAGSLDVQDLIPREASIVRNDDWAEGQSRSLHVAVHYARVFGYDDVVIGLGDQPFIPPSAWRAVAESDSPIAVATFGSQSTPPVRLSDTVWNLLPVEGDEGARQLLRSRPELVAEIPCEGSAVDVDTAGDFDQVRRHHLAKELQTWT